MFTANNYENSLISVNFFRTAFDNHCGAFVTNSRPVSLRPALGWSGSRLSGQFFTFTQRPWAGIA
jgi:hypothetical protein